MKKIWMRTAAGVLAAVMLFPCQVSAISAQRAIVMDGVTGRVLYEKDADVSSRIASTTKIMTALLVCQQCNVLDRVRIPKEAVGVEGSSMYLREGEVLTVQELLYGLMLSSGNDAAVALAIYCGGTVEGFVALMNDKARQLGMTGTHFANPNGLDHPEHYATARDLAILARYAMEDPIFAQIAATKTVSVAERTLRNHNKLLWQVAGADGVKTGFTKASGRVLVSSATRDGRRLIAVTIRDPDDWRDHATLLEAGFSQYQVRQIVSAGEQVGSVSVISGKETSAPLVAETDFFYAMTKQEQAEIVMPAPGFAYAPVVEGADAGVAHICIDGVSVGTVRIRYGQTVEQQQPERRSWWQRLWNKERN